MEMSQINHFKQRYVLNIFVNRHPTKDMESHTLAKQYAFFSYVVSNFKFHQDGTRRVVDGQFNQI